MSVQNPKHKYKEGANLQGKVERVALERVALEQIFHNEGALAHFYATLELQKERESMPGAWDKRKVTKNTEALSRLAWRAQKHDISPHELQSLPVGDFDENDACELLPMPILPEYAEMNRVAGAESKNDELCFDFDELPKQGVRRTWKSH